MNARCPFPTFNINICVIMFPSMSINNVLINSLVQAQVKYRNMMYLCKYIYPSGAVDKVVTLYIY